MRRVPARFAAVACVALLAGAPAFAKKGMLTPGGRTLSGGFGVGSNNFLDFPDGDWCVTVINHGKAPVDVYMDDPVLPGVGKELAPGQGYTLCGASRRFGGVNCTSQNPSRCRWEWRVDLL